MNKSFKPGQIWLDDKSKPIEAHAGGVFYEDNTFYWYGENKEFTTGKSNVWTSGIRCYSSKDLYNWHDEGYIIPPSNDENSSFHPYKNVDRPHILKNQRTNKYVCWLKLSGEYGYFVVLTADSLLGPYTIVKDHYKPFGHKIGDFDFDFDEKTNKAYLYFDEDHQRIVSATLTEDYTELTDEYYEHYTDLYPPFTREAPAHFVRNKKHYLITSGLMGYIPNPSEAAVSTNWHGPFENLGNPHVNDESCASFNSQISYIFKHPKHEDLYIAIADRWLPEYPVDKKRNEFLTRCIAAGKDEKYQATMEERRSLLDTPMLKKANTSKARYIWLPIKFDGDVPKIEWYDEWKIEDFI